MIFIIFNVNGNIKTQCVNYIWFVRHCILLNSPTDFCCNCRFVSICVHDVCAWCVCMCVCEHVGLIHATFNNCMLYVAVTVPPLRPHGIVILLIFLSFSLYLLIFIFFAVWMHSIHPKRSQCNNCYLYFSEEEEEENGNQEERMMCCLMYRSLPFALYFYYTNIYHHLVDQ